MKFQLDLYTLRKLSQNCSSLPQRSLGRESKKSHMCLNQITCFNERGMEQSRSRRLGYLCGLLLILLHCSASGAEAAPSVAPESPVCPEERGLAAYRFGLQIQNAVRARDLAAFFSLVDGELERGPRRKHAEGKAFHELFSAAWREEILQTKPACDPVGWRGFMLGNGSLWYRSDHVFAVNGWAPEVLPAVPEVWQADGKLLSPRCFAYQSPSGDLFESYAHRFSIAKDRFTPEFADFERNPGKYFGTPILPFHRDAPSLWRYLDDCAEAADASQAKNAAHTRGEAERYEVLAGIAPERCQSLAPELPGECLAARLLHRFSLGDGSMSVWGTHGIYGLFRMEDGARILFPLKYFDSENLARNFLDD